MGVEVGPLSPFDEYPIHQAAEPLRYMATSDGRAFDRYYFSIYDPQQAFLLDVGFGVYPNVGTADAFAAFAHDNTHTAVRSNRLIGNDRANMKFLPLEAEVITPFQEWRLRMAENEYGLSFDLRFFDTKRAVFVKRHPVPHSYDGYVTADLHSGYEGFGRAEGWISHKGQRFGVDRRDSLGTRDHHWGIREGMGGRSLMTTARPLPRHTHCSQYVEFPEWGVWAQRLLYNVDDVRPGADDVTIERFLRFDPDTRAMTGGTFRNRLADGTVKEVQYEQVERCVIYLRTGGYIGPDLLGTPGDDHSHGEFIGDGVVSGESVDVSSAPARIDLQGMTDRLVRGTCDGVVSYGILETIDPIAFELCEAGAPGFNFE